MAEVPTEICKDPAMYRAALYEASGLLVGGWVLCDTKARCCVGRFDRPFGCPGPPVVGFTGPAAITPTRPTLHVTPTRKTQRRLVVECRA
jgi:hypothetical protein